jgi:hypothetical protein
MNNSLYGGSVDVLVKAGIVSKIRHDGSLLRVNRRPTVDEVMDFVRMVK